MRTYDAFLSFDPKSDSRLAAETTELQRFAKPWYQLRARRIFRVPKEAAAESWDSIESAIQGSRYFILIASPASASSDFVERELSAWIRYSPSARERILIVLSDGEISWNESKRNFDFHRSTAIPRVLSDLFKSEPTYIDLRWARSAPRRIGRPEFSEAVATMVAAISGQSLDALYGLEFRQKRRAKAAAVVAAGALAFQVI